MGDRRFQPHYDGLRDSPDRLTHIRDMSDRDVVEALAAASRENDPYIANILATEATNRMERARSEVRNLGEGLCSLDNRGRILSANPAAEELLGRSQGELVGQDFDSLCRDGSKGHKGRPAAGAYHTALLDGVVVECESELFYRQDGSAFDVSYTAAPIVAGDSIDGIVIAFRDMSSRKQAHNQLRVSEERYRSLFENSPGFVFSTNLDGTIDAAGANAELFSGRDGADLRGRPLRSLVAPEDLAAVTRIFEVARRGKAARAAVSLVRHDGRITATSLLVMPIILHGEIVGVYGTAETRGVAERPADASPPGGGSHPTSPRGTN